MEVFSSHEMSVSSGTVCLVKDFFSRKICFLHSRPLWLETATGRGAAAAGGHPLEATRSQTWLHSAGSDRKEVQYTPFVILHDITTRHAARGEERGQDGRRRTRENSSLVALFCKTYYKSVEIWRKKSELQGTTWAQLQREEEGGRRSRANSIRATPMAHI